MTAHETGRRLGRVDSFSDGLFAIAATLLALSIDVPDVPERDLNGALDSLLPSVLAYFISFAVVGLFWLRHHEFFGRLAASDSLLAAINLVFLSFVALLPVPTEILGKYDTSTAPVVIYAVFILILSGLLRALFHHARRADLLAPGQHVPVDNAAALGVWIAFGLSIPLAYRGARLRDVLLDPGGRDPAGAAPVHRSRAGVSARCARLAASTAFNVAIFAVILANAVVLGLQTYDSIVEDAGGLLDALNAVFLAVFVVELAIRIAAYGSRPGDFFRDGWNVFDFVVVAIALAPVGSSNSALLRLARLARVLRVVRILPELRLLVVAVGRSLPGVVSLAVMGVLVLFVYGMIGWLWFADEFPADWGNIGDAMLTLFVLLSLESLPDMIDQGLEVSDWTILYYVSFVLVASFLLLNILIGVVIDSLDKAREMEFDRTQADRRAAAAATEGGGDDAAVELLQHVHDLRRTLENVEREARAVVRAESAQRRSHGSEPPLTDRLGCRSLRGLFCQDARRSLRLIPHGSGIPPTSAPPGSRDRRWRPRSHRWPRDPRRDRRAAGVRIARARQRHRGRHRDRRTGARS